MWHVHTEEYSVLFNLLVFHTSKGEKLPIFFKTPVNFNSLN